MNSRSRLPVSRVKTLELFEQNSIEKNNNRERQKTHQESSQPSIKLNKTKQYESTAKRHKNLNQNENIAREIEKRHTGTPNLVYIFTGMMFAMPFDRKRK